ncbi:MAG: GNAT family N-acetyltransferase [Spirochaetales bacterium]|uniref:GNAT family N-acetyltransferase n=1 Tax=Candidatus Thalassospirochaeta sargassi TaxID=3119039 RepID=A0AAJ1ICY2_9SPIO|nr:GNAT family N-acetyltransferase [Spirochaetales bacterium]
MEKISLINLMFQVAITVNFKDIGANGNKGKIDLVNKMIKCTNENKNELLTFLKHNPAENCFIIGDLENYSMDEEFIEIWMIRKKKNITTVLLRFYNYYTVSTHDEDDIEEIINHLNAEKELITLTGVESVIDKISKGMEFSKIKRANFAELIEIKNYKENLLIDIKKANIEEINELFEFHKSIKEFEVKEESKENFGKELLDNTGRIYYTRENKKIVSMAMITAENSVNGMIMGVATAQKYRRKGYARAIVQEICKSMIDNGKSVVLFYDNPEAGKMYKEIGFEDINRQATIYA